MPISFIHTADVHLGAPLSLFGSYAETRQKEFQQTFSKIIDIAIEKKIPLMLIAGDLFDDVDIDRSLIGWACEELRRFGQNDGTTVILPGTHDHMEGGNWALKSLMNVHLLDSPVITEPLTLTINDEVVHIYGFAYQFGQTPEDWRPMMQRRDSEGYHIGILHGALRKSQEWTIPEKDLPFTLLDLAELNLDYLALGHYHQSQTLEHDAKIIASYSGSPEGKSFSEDGERFTHIVTINEPKDRPEIEKISVQTKQLKQIAIETTGAADQDAIIRQIQSHSQENLIVKVSLSGIAEFPIEIEKITKAVAQNFSYIELRNETTLIDSSWIEQLKDEITIRGAFVRRALAELEKAQTVDDKMYIRMAMNEVLAEFQRNSNDLD